MALTESLDAFLEDFGVTVTSGALSGLGLLDMPDQIIGSIAVSSDLGVVLKASVFGNLDHGASITVNGTTYTVREVLKMDDGAFVRVTLSQ